MKLQLGSHNVFHLPHNRQFNTFPHTSRSLADVPTMVERSPSSTTQATASTSDPTPAETEDKTNLIIGLSVAIPIVIAIAVLVYLHRRIKRKQRQEDARDPHKSLDFGLDEVVKSKKGGRQAKLPEMAISDIEKSTMEAVRPSHGKGMSLDIANPYLLPAAVNESRESFHSLSRNLSDDPYRPVTMVSNHSAPRYPKNDTDSVYTTSSIPSGDVMSAGLLKNASRMSRSDPFATKLSSPVESRLPPFHQQDKPFPPRNVSAQPAPPVVRITDASPAVVESRLPAVIESRQPAVIQSRQPAALQRPNIPSVNVDLANDYQEFHVTPPSPPVVQSTARPTIEETTPENNRLSTVQSDARRVSVMGLRPLPPDDPADNPEQRAIRIRSFYKEYFDDSKPNPAGYYPEYNPYAEEHHEAEYYEDGTMYDHRTGAPISAPAPSFAQPIQRRAFTPPPAGAAPRARGRSNTTSMQSTGHINNPAFRGPRNQPPAKKLPPPSALKSLPAPSKLQGDDVVFLNPTDFAPAPTYRDQRLGRGLDSPLGTTRPYSPAFHAHSPLVKSFDDLAALPSPHLLRKSGTFTSLDFAPPPRFRNQDGNGSDAGSIRSNHSGISAVANQNIRNGAYRVSRLPGQMVGTKDDFALALKPTWELRGVNPGST